MTARVRNEDGWVVVTATTLLAIMLISGLALLAGVDTGQVRSREQRERESAFNLTEGVLFNQAFVLAQSWPGGQNPSYPAKCLTNSGTNFCPTTASLKNNFTTADFARKSDWVTRVRDNYGELAAAYVPEKADGPLTGAQGTCNINPCSRDFNGDRQVWVHARATAQGQARSVVALMKLEQLQESMPQAAVSAGAISVTNSSSVNDRPLMDGSGSNIVVRCPPEPPRTGGNGTATCTNYRDGQMTPAPKQTNSDPNSPDYLPAPLLSDEQMARFRAKALVNGTHYLDCPPDNFRGEIVFVEKCYNPPVYQNGGATVDPPCNAPSGLKNSCTNRIDRPGLIIVKCGGLVMGGQWTYVGIVYLANNAHERSGQNADCASGMRGNGTCDDKSFGPNDVLEMRGGFGIWGVIAAEGPACVKFGSQGFQFKYDNAVYGALVSYGTVGLVQNTWRELLPAQGA